MGLFRELWEINHRSEVRRSDGPTTRFAGCPVEMDGGGYHYHQALLEEMRQEWGCLKKNDLPSLLPLLQLKEDHMRTIKGHRKSIIQIVNGFLGEAAGEDRPGVLSDLLPLVSPSQAQKIKSYQREIERLLRQITLLNEQNKRFIQETLALFGRGFSPC